MRAIVAVVCYWKPRGVAVCDPSRMRGGGKPQLKSEQTFLLKFSFLCGLRCYFLSLFLWHGCDSNITMENALTSVHCESVRERGRKAGERENYWENSLAIMEMDKAGNNNRSFRGQ